MHAFVRFVLSTQCSAWGMIVNGRVKGRLVGRVSVASK
jgi:hypothetical protein